MGGVGGVGEVRVEVDVQRRLEPRRQGFDVLDEVGNDGGGIWRESGLRRRVGVGQGHAADGCGDHGLWPGSLVQGRANVADGRHHVLRVLAGNGLCADDYVQNVIVGDVISANLVPDEVRTTGEARQVLVSCRYGDELVGMESHDFWMRVIETELGDTAVCHEVDDLRRRREVVCHHAVTHTETCCRSWIKKKTSSFSFQYSMIVNNMKLLDSGYN